MDKPKRKKYYHVKRKKLQEFKPDDILIDTEKRGMQIVYLGEILDKGKKCGGLDHAYLENFV